MTYHCTSSPRRPVFRQTLIACAIGHLALGATWMTAPATAHAQTVAQAGKHHYQIPAGTLENVLNQFGRTAGALVLFDPSLVQGMQSGGLNGDYTVQEGLRQLLAPHQLEAATGDGQGYHIRQRSTVATLDTVRVTGVTEGTGSYTTNLTNTATKLDLTLRETPQSVTVMTHKRIEDQGLDEISKVLDQTTGLYFNNTNTLGGDNNFIYSRGFALENYQVNGVPRSTRFGFQNDIADTSVFDRVEVVRGASGLLNGIGEPSGAVNLVRKRPLREQQIQMAAKYGSWNFRRVEADASSPLTEDGSVRGRLIAAYQDNDTFVDRVNMKKKILYGVIEADLTPDTTLSAGIEYQDHETTGGGDAYSGAPLFFSDGTPTNFSSSTNLAADWGFTTRKNLTVFATLEHYFQNDWRVQLDLEHSQRKYDIVAPALDWRRTKPDGSGEMNIFRYYGKPEQNSVNIHAVGPFSLLGRTHELVVGASYYRLKEKGLNHNDYYGLPIANVYEFIATGQYPQLDMGATGSGLVHHDEQSGFYAATRLNPIENVHVILGSRLSNWKTRTDRFNTAGVTTRGVTNKETAVLTPYAGIVVDLNDTVSVYASYTDIFRPSTNYDASGNLLDPAEGSNIEGGIKMAFLDNRLNVSAAVYQTKKDNVPEYVPGPGGAINRGPTGQYVYEGIDGTKTTGFELEVSGELTPNWQIAGGFSYSKPKDANGNPRLTYVPRKTLKLFTSYQPQWLLEGLTLGANLRWQDSIYSNRSGNYYRQGSLAIVDLMAHYEITRNLSATLNVNNVFNKSYYTDINVSGWYGEPRSAFVNLRYKF